jgi:hypothetical protein
LAAPPVHSALAITRRWRLQLSRVDQENSLNRRAGAPLTLLSSSAAASSSAISATSRSFLARPNRKSTPLASHQLIKASRANPESARSTMRISGHRARIWATMRAVSSTAPAAASMSARRSFAASRCGPLKMYSGR